jgi:nitroimidazol reductase NimA-like FMN-containing flavoprotein (pyridoxamine 5'-phosphate oxidase superfamily)
METFTRQITPLTTAECFSLMADSVIGRVAYWDGGPVVLPIAFLVDGDAIVFRTDGRSRLATVGIGSELALEIDDVEPALRSGRSVLARGVGNRVVDDDRLETYRRRLWAWAPGERDCFIRMPIAQVTGRRIIPSREWMPAD